jgi:hypothetical protein
MLCYLDHIRIEYTSCAIKCFCDDCVMVAGYNCVIVLDYNFSTCKEHSTIETTKLAWFQQ